MDDQEIMIQQPAPTFTAQAVYPSKEIQSLSLTQYVGSYVVLFFYPADHTFVCPTEICSFSDRQPEFTAINTQVIAISCDSTFSHLAWINMPRSQGGLGDMKIPIVSDMDKSIARQYGVLIEDEGVPLRGLFIISPTGILRQTTVNDLPVGRNVDEIVRLIQAFQFTDTHGEVCPANWQPGSATMNPDPIKSKEYFSSSSDGRPRVTNTASGPGEVTHIRFGGLIQHDQKIVNSQSKGLLGWMRRQFRCILHSYCMSLKNHPLRTRALTTSVLAMLGELLGVFVRHRRMIMNTPKNQRENRSSSYYQQFVGWNGEDGANVISIQRLLSFGLYGLVIGGPVNHYWHVFMNHLLMPSEASTRGLAGETRLFWRVGLSQVVLAPPFFVVMVGALRHLTGQTPFGGGSQALGIVYVSFHNSCSSTLTCGISLKIPTRTLSSMLSSSYGLSPLTSFIDSSLLGFRNAYAAAIFTNWKWWTLARVVNQALIPKDHRVLVEHLVALWWHTYLSVYIAPRPRRG